MKPLELSAHRERRVCEIITELEAQASLFEPLTLDELEAKAEAIYDERFESGVYDGEYFK